MVRGIGMALHPGTETGDLVCETTIKAAAGGATDAWDAIVSAFSGIVRAAASSVLRETAEIDSACRITWLRCADHLEEVDARSIGPWLISTVCREARRQARLPRRADCGARAATV